MYRKSRGKKIKVFGCFLQSQLGKDTKGLHDVFLFSVKELANTMKIFYAICFKTTVGSWFCDGKWFCQLNYSQRGEQWASYSCASSLTSDKAIFQPTRVHKSTERWQHGRTVEDVWRKKEKERTQVEGRKNRRWRKIETRWTFCIRFSKWQSACTFPSIHNALTAKNASRCLFSSSFCFILQRFLLRDVKKKRNPFGDLKSSQHQ